MGIILDKNINNKYVKNELKTTKIAPPVGLGILCNF